MRLTAPKSVEADQLGTEIDFAANKAMGPERIDVEGATQQGHGASLRAATNEDHQPFGIRLKVRLPRGEERTLPPPLLHGGQAGGEHQGRLTDHRHRGESYDRLARPARKHDDAAAAALRPCEVERLGGLPLVVTHHERRPETVRARRDTAKGSPAT